MKIFLQEKAKAQLNKLLKKKLSEIKLPMHKFSKKIQTKFVKIIRKNHEKQVVFYLIQIVLLEYNTI